MDLQRLAVHGDLAASGLRLGVAANVAANAAPLLAVEPWAGRLSVKSPSCGIHSLRHTSQRPWGSR
jgi:hypothetical protein